MLIDIKTGLSFRLPKNDKAIMDMLIDIKTGIFTTKIYKINNVKNSFDIACNDITTEKKK